MIRTFSKLSLIVVFLSGCESQDVPEINDLDNHSMTQSDEVHHYTFAVLTAPDKLVQIDLDTVEIAEMRSGYSVSNVYTREGDEYFHGRLVSTAIFNGGMYVADSSNQHIYRKNNLGILEWVAGRSGRGPGEFLGLHFIDANRNFLFAQDRNQLKTLVFTTEYEPVGEIQNGSLGTIAAGDNLLLVPSTFGGDYFFDIISPESPFDKKGVFLAHVIPQGMQPTGYRSAKAAINDQGHVVVHIQGIPQLYFFDEELNHLSTVEILGEEVVAITNNNPEVKPVKTLQYPEGVVNNIITALYFSDDMVLISIRRKLYWFKYENGKVELQSAYHFHPPNSSDSPDSLPLGLYDVMYDVDSNDICLTAPFYEQRYCYSVGID